MTRSAGQTGLILEGSPLRSFTASLIAAKSTTAGTPLNKMVRRCQVGMCTSIISTQTHVKSCIITREGLNGISTLLPLFTSHFKIFSTSFLVTTKSSQFLTADSNSTLTEKGRRSKDKTKQRISFK